MTPPTPERARDPELERLGARLKSTRDYLGISQQYVADATGIPRSAVSDIERGARRVDSLELKKLAKLYGRPVSYLLAEDDADLGAHVLAGLPRALAGLTDGDRQEVVKFAEFLAFKRMTAEEDTVEAGPPDAPPEVR